MGALEEEFRPMTLFLISCLAFLVLSSRTRINTVMQARYRSLLLLPSTPFYLFLLSHPQDCSLRLEKSTVEHRCELTPPSAREQ